MCVGVWGSFDVYQPAGGEQRSVISHFWAVVCCGSGEEPALPIPILVEVFLINRRSDEGFDNISDRGCQPEHSYWPAKLLSERFWCCNLQASLRCVLVGGLFLHGIGISGARSYYLVGGFGVWGRVGSGS